MGSSDALTRIQCYKKAHGFLPASPPVKCCIVDSKITEVNYNNYIEFSHCL